MADKILFVDDEPNVLMAIQRGLRKRYELETALGGQEAIDKLNKNGPFAVIVSDMRMPGMNGAQLLLAAKDIAPDTVRIMLTGNADQKTAIEAINHGDILRFLNKPVDTKQINEALDAGLKQHKLIIAERETLENTLRASVQSLVEILALADPEIFGRSMRLKDRMHQIIQAMNLDNSWEWETIALLSQIGCISIPNDLVKRKASGVSLLPEEQSQFSEHTAVGADLLSKIPRLEDVTASIRYQDKNYDGSGYPKDGITADAIPMGARIMRVILDLDIFITGGESASDALLCLKKHQHLYDSQIISAVEDVLLQNTQREILNIPLTKLRDDMQIASDVYTSTGMLLMAKGQNMSQAAQRHLRNYHENGLIDSTIDVWGNGAK
ncbi:MAG: response regulator RpfG family c-di-GMP phosphodiesterase [Granulosicoccus sp.]